ncbi:MAG: LuxR C-terminal-related transcriptional regulator [Chthoniobacterales bacterium]
MNKTRKPGALQPKLTRIVIADDHTLTRELMVSLISKDCSHCQVVGQANDPAEALRQCQKLKADLLLFAVSTKGRYAAVEAIPTIKSALPDLRILLCATLVTKEKVVAALRAGANGVVEKTSTAKELVEGIERIAGGETYLCRRSLQMLSESLRGPAAGLDAQRSPLTSREKEILSLIASGLTSKEIAARLFLSVATVDTHRANLMSKVGAHNVAQLIQYGTHHGVL